MPFAMRQASRSTRFRSFLRISMRGSPPLNRRKRWRRDEPTRKVESMLACDSVLGKRAAKATERSADEAAPRRAARRSGFDWDQGGMRRRRVWLLLRAPEWRISEQLPASNLAGRRRGDSDRGRLGSQWRAPPTAEGVSRARRSAVWNLHTRNVDGVGTTSPKESASWHG